jgi:hypothetical protein
MLTHFPKVLVSRVTGRVDLLTGTRPVSALIGLVSWCSSSRFDRRQAPGNTRQNGHRTKNQRPSARVTRKCGAWDRETFDSWYAQTPENHHPFCAAWSSYCRSHIRLCSILRLRKAPHAHGRWIGIAWFIFCPPTLLFAMCVDCEVSGWGGVIIFSIIGGFNAALYAAVGAVVDSLQRKSKATL